MAPYPDVEGSAQDEQDHHTGPGALPEGSAEDQAADQALAQQLAASGEQPVPADGSTPGSTEGGQAAHDAGAADPNAGMPPAADPAAADPPMTDPAAPPTSDPGAALPPGVDSNAALAMPPTAQPSAVMGNTGMIQLTVPLPSLQISVKMAEAPYNADEDLKAFYSQHAHLFKA
jgi:hypothetical protein